MRTACSRAMIAAVLLVAGASAYAQSPEVREAEAREATALAAGVKRTNELCGARIAATVDWRALVPTGSITKNQAGRRCASMRRGAAGRSQALQISSFREASCCHGNHADALQLQQQDACRVTSRLPQQRHHGLRASDMQSDAHHASLGHHRPLSAVKRSPARFKHHRREPPRNGWSLCSPTSPAWRVAMPPHSRPPR
jgi:hypothetical protein